ncbi:hypothetical protein EK21DRAFT_21436, partial [Setomelanomma holmii]
MSYLLTFPTTTLPTSIRKPPFTIIAINGTCIHHFLPRFIPLAALLHFIPALSAFVLPAPTTLPPAVAKAVLVTGPFVGLDIRLDVRPAALQRIILKVLQCAGSTVPQHQYHAPPRLEACSSILRTWKLLELPAAGVDGVKVHMHAILMFGPAVTFTALQHLWEMFPPTHPILRLAADSFVEAHCGLAYSCDHFRDIRAWYRQDSKRHAVFQAAEQANPEFGEL